jgi:hypothetical protein
LSFSWLFKRNTRAPEGASPNIRAGKAANGTSRHFAATQHLGRFWS